MKKEYEKLMSLLKRGHSAVLCTRKLEGERTEKWVLRAEEAKTEKKADFMEYYMPEERLIILGGGHVSQPLAKFGVECGFAVTVVDDRPDFANCERFQEAQQIMCENFQSCFDKLHITSEDYVVVVTRGHHFDMDCLRHLLSGTEPAYMGMMGSKRRVAGVRELLLSEGYDKEVVNHIHMPIGLSIGALSPAEIAVSILGEVIQKRRLGNPDTEIPKADTDFRVLERLAVETGPYAAATVLSTKGSTPRQSGAKMIIYPEGRILGSIGGGFAEAQIIKKALKYIGTDKSVVVTVDMTKAVYEGYTERSRDLMVCGGVMDVLIEGNKI